MAGVLGGGGGGVGGGWVPQGQGHHGPRWRQGTVYLGPRRHVMNLLDRNRSLSPGCWEFLRLLALGVPIGNLPNHLMQCFQFAPEDVAPYQDFLIQCGVGPNVQAFHGVLLRDLRSVVCYRRPPPLIWNAPDVPVTVCDYWRKKSTVEMPRSSRLLASPPRLPGILLRLSAYFVKAFVDAWGKAGREKLAKDRLIMVTRWQMIVATLFWHAKGTELEAAGMVEDLRTADGVLPLKDAGIRAADLRRLMRGGVPDWREAERLIAQRCVARHLPTCQPGRLYPIASPLCEICQHADRAPVSLVLAYSGVEWQCSSCGARLYVATSASDAARNAAYLP